ncbi:hypothetical protein [Pseudomonas wenzhouensis]|uniref:hypothetical protein n=1 Tax=Pseudomonas wenzhouensis TaxID=2906062 RepID=UPI001E4B7C2A|nr:hypothetical protein [Pseudomonas wenzhouensis]UFQ97023.1 hypothetical protein J7655_17305 [Pseudomonas wenzhouensis]
MTDKPQVALEEIELIPHPMDAWRASLDALIACAPGDGPAIAAHLAEARQQALMFVDRTPATAGTRKLVDYLMLIGAGRLVGQKLDSRNALGFRPQAEVIGIDFAASHGRQPAAQLAPASSSAHAAQPAHQASSSPASSAPAAQGPRPAAPAEPQGKASSAQAPESAPQPAVTEPRPSGDSPCL